MLAPDSRFVPAPAPARAWEVLSAAGLPDGAARRSSLDRFVDQEVSAALLEVAKGPALDQTSRELLQAWLCALRDHFPTRFASLPQARELLASVAAAPTDAGRFLKFRRIAIERLAHLI